MAAVLEWVQAPEGCRMATRACGGRDRWADRLFRQDVDGAADRTAEAAVWAVSFPF